MSFLIKERANSVLLELSDDKPALDLSSDSSSDEELASSRKQSLMDLSCAVDARLSSPDQRRREILQAALKYGDMRSQSVLDYRTSVSSPARTSSAFRERIHQRARKRVHTLKGSSSFQPYNIRGEVTYDGDEHLYDADTFPTFDEDARTGFVRIDVSSNPDESHGNRVKLNIYDLIAQDTLMQLPWGCICEIGKCFNEVNSALHAVGTGAYHVGVEVNGIEYAFGATSTPGKSGVFSCKPGRSPGYQYRTTIDFGVRSLIRRKWVSVEKSGSTVFQEKQDNVDGKDVIQEMVKEYMGVDYDILRRNCCTFARDACLRLGVEDHEIPSWFRNLAESGVVTQDLAIATIDSIEPLSNVFSTCEEENKVELKESEDGFEIISNTNMDKFTVIDAKTSSSSILTSLGVRRSMSWAY